MPEGIDQSHDEGGDPQGSSQDEGLTQAAKGPSLRPREGGRTKYTESEDIDTEAASTCTVDEARDELMETQDDFPSNEPSVQEGKTTRTLRSRLAKQEPADPTEQTRGSRVIIKPTKRARSDDDDFEPQKPAKRGRKPSVNTEIKGFDKDMRGLLERFTSKAKETESLRAEIQDLRDQVERRDFKLQTMQRDYKENKMLLKKKNDELQDENDQLRVANDELQHTNDELQTNLRKRTSQLIDALDENKRDSVRYIKVSDADITEAWMMLSYNVRDLVAQCLTGQTSNQLYSLPSLVRWHRFHSLEDVMSLRTNVLRKATWKILDSAIFSGSKRIWQGELGQILTYRLSGKDHASIKDPRYPKIISQIKSSVIADLDEHSHLDQDALHSEIERASREFQLFIPESKDRQFRDKMKRLIEQAANVHVMMMKSKAIFQVKWFGDDDGTYQTNYDPVTMEVLLGSGGAGVYDFFIFVEAPGLVKIGNADGENFDQDMVLCKSQVILGEAIDKVVLEPDFQVSCGRS